MLHKEVLLLQSDDPIEPKFVRELCTEIEKHGILVRFPDLESFALERCPELLLEHGQTSLLSMRRITEEVLPKADGDDRCIAVKMIRKYIERVAPCSELIINDPFLLHVQKPDFMDLRDTLCTILKPVAQTLEHLIMIGKRGGDSDSVFSDLREGLRGLNRGITVKRKYSNEFHDRIWIADRARGFYTGTSLTGFGKKYSLIDKIRPDDVKELIALLKSSGLIE